MKTSIKINDKYIQKILLGSTPVQRIYQSGSIVYEAGGSTPTPCFEVVGTISQASGNYVDVYVKPESKWYKRNNLSQYEEYGLMPTVTDLSSTTYYTGKLVVLSTDSHEYKWNGSEWIDLGNAVTIIDCIWLDPSSNNSSYQIGYYWGTGYKMVFNVYLSGSYSGDAGGFLNHNSKSPLEFNFYSNGFYFDMHDPQSTSNNSCYSGDYSNRLMKTSVLQNYQSEQVINFTVTYGTVKAELEEGGTLIGKWGTERTGQSWYNGLYSPLIGIGSAKPYHLSRIRVYDNNNNLVNDLKFVENEGETGSQKLSVYDSVLDVKYNNTNSNTPTYHITQKGKVDPPVDYDEKVAPADNVHYDTLLELEMMECPWIGMKATVGDNNIPYKYTEDGWVDNDYSESYFTIESLVDNNIINFYCTSIYADINVKFSTNDGGSWSTKQASNIEIGTTICTLNKGEKVIFKGNIKSIPGKSCKFIGNGGFKVYGNILSLIYEDNFVNKTSIGSDRTFTSLFNATHVVDAGNLVLPVASLPKDCYNSMFKSCKQLVKAPSFESVSSMGETACYGMFDGCNSLATPIKITVDTLSKQCMDYMFRDCTSLKSAIVNIGNITINQYGLQQMFSGCKSLEDVEINYNGSLPTAGSSNTSTILYRCFYNCIHLKRIKAMFTSLGENGSRVQTMEWVSGVPATGTFIQNVKATWDETGVSGVPTGWTVVTAKP